MDNSLTLALMSVTVHYGYRGGLRRLIVVSQTSGASESLERRYARMKRIQRSVTVRRLVVFLKPPDLLHFSLMAGAVHIARPTCTGVRRDAQHLSFCLCPGSGSACEAGTCAAHRDRVPRVARVSTAPPSCPHAPSGVRKAADGQPLSVGWCTGCGGVCKLH